MDLPLHPDIKIDEDIAPQLPVGEEEEEEPVLLPADIVPEERKFDTIEEVDVYVTDYMKRAENGIVIHKSSMNPNECVGNMDVSTDRNILQNVLGKIFNVNVVSKHVVENVLSSSL